MTNAVKPLKLKNHFQNYDWGTQSAIPELLGIPRPDGNEMLAEYWVGAHPALPSIDLESKRALNEIITESSATILGEKHEQMGHRLPYLFKVLSAARALSIQVHPNKSQAEQGFARERAADIDEHSPNCNYKDANHKPELMYALTPFKAMVGFRNAREIALLLNELGVDQLKAWVSKLESNETETLKELYSWLLYLDDSALEELCTASLIASSKLNGEPWSTISDLHQLYGNDPGVLFPLLLKVFTLEPGQAVYLGAGIPHAYLEGTGLEIMANSDNVLRGGLTKKHMDKPELIQITKFDSGGSEVQTGTVNGDRRTFAIPCPDFQFELIELKDKTSIGDSLSAELIFVLDGNCEINGLPLSRAESALLPAAAGESTISGNAKLARITTKFGFDQNVPN